MSKEQEEGRRKKFFSLRRELARLKEKGVDKPARWIWGHGWQSGYIQGHFEGHLDAMLAGISKMGGESWRSQRG